MDTIDRKILSIINNMLPIAERPFKVVAQSVGISEEETIDRIKKLKAQRIIRRIGSVIYPGEWAGSLHCALLLSPWSALTSLLRS